MVVGEEQALFRVVAGAHNSLACWDLSYNSSRGSRMRPPGGAGIPSVVRGRIVRWSLSPPIRPAAPTGSLSNPNRLWESTAQGEPGPGTPPTLTLFWTTLHLFRSGCGADLFLPDGRHVERFRDHRDPGESGPLQVGLQLLCRGAPARMRRTKPYRRLARPAETPPSPESRRSDSGCRRRVVRRASIHGRPPRRRRNGPTRRCA